MKAAMDLWYHNHRATRRGLATPHSQAATDLGPLGLGGDGGPSCGLSARDPFILKSLKLFIQRPMPILTTCFAACSSPRACTNASSNTAEYLSRFAIRQQSEGVLLKNLQNR